MADILLDVQSKPSTPSAGQAIYYVDTTSKIKCLLTDDGLVDARTSNAALASQGAGFATDTYVTNSDLIIPGFGFQAKSFFLWQLSASKTGAGIATPIYNIRIGSARTVAGDTARLTLTGPAQTAIADIGTLWIAATVRNIGAACVIQGTAYWVHRGTAASTTVGGVGFANDMTGHVEGTAASFDSSSLAGQYVGLSINGGASAAWTVTQVIARAEW